MDGVRCRLAPMAPVVVGARLGESADARGSGRRGVIKNGSVPPSAPRIK
jgi:hypothetical protein